MTQDVEEDNKEKMSTSTKLAIGGTVFWLGGVAWYAASHWCKLSNMDPNAIGDFLAGTMSPLALFWLVAGYWQQGEELKLNTKALIAQQEELAKQVQATHLLAEIGRDQTEISRSDHQLNMTQAHRAREDRQRLIEPNIEFSFSHKNSQQWQLYAHNSGGDAFQMSVESKYFREIISMGKEVPFKRGTRRAVQLNTPLWVDGPIFLTVRCFDADDSYHVFHYKHDVISNQFILVPPSELPEEQWQITPD